MKLNQTQKDLLRGILEHTVKDLDIQDSMEFGEDLREILTQVELLEVVK